VPEDKRRGEPSGDLTAKEISKYITDSGVPEATIVASDEALIRSRRGMRKKFGTVLNLDRWT
jgi:hypothetical protein